MTDLPDRLTLARNRELGGISKRPWARWAILSLIAVFALLGLANVFGQRPGMSVAAGPAARLELYAPEHLRGGLLFSARFTISARQEVKNATLVLDPGWVEGMSVNTIEPSPLGEGSHDGKLVLELGHIPAGQKHVLWMQFQVNPTNVAWHRPAGVTLLDGSKTLTHIDRRYTIYP